MVVLIKHLTCIGTVDTATGAFRRVHSQNGEENVTVVKQMSRAGIALDQPTIAVITAHYFEKMAVDAVMKDRKTFVRYATVGKSNLVRPVDSHQMFSP